MSRKEALHKQLTQSLAQQWRRASSRAVMLHTAVAERLGLNPSDHKCVDLMLSESGEFTPGRMAELTGLSTGAITGVLDRLERAGFVAREADPSDRRRTLVRLTPARMPNMTRIFSPLAQGVERVCANYTTAELSVISRFMRDSELMAIAAMEEVRKQSEAVFAPKR